MSPAAWPGNPPGHGSGGPSGTAELLCALSYGSGLAVAERMEHGTNTAFVGIQLGRALGLGAADLEAVFYGALLKDVGCGACGAVLAPFFADDELAPRLDLMLVDVHSARSMGGWAKGQLRLDPTLPARLARLAAFASQCGAVAHEAMAAHCEIAADFAARLGFGRHVQDAVHFQYERHDGRGPAFGRRADAIPRAAEVLHVALAADVARSPWSAPSRRPPWSAGAWALISSPAWPRPTLTWRAVGGRRVTIRSRSQTCSPVTRGPGPMSCPVTAAGRVRGAG